MRTNIYAVHDSKAEAYLQPFFSPNHAVAIRSFQAAAQQEGHQFNKHAADYTLFHVGEWDEQKGTVTNRDNINLGNAIELQGETQ